MHISFSLLNTTKMHFLELLREIPGTVFFAKNLDEAREHFPELIEGGTEIHSEKTFPRMRVFVLWLTLIKLSPQIHHIPHGCTVCRDERWKSDLSRTDVHLR